MKSASGIKHIPVCLQTLSGLVSQPLGSANGSALTTSALPLWGLRSSNATLTANASVAVRMDSCTLVLPQVRHYIAFFLLLFSVSAVTEKFVRDFPPMLLTQQGFGQTYRPIEKLQGPSTGSTVDVLPASNGSLQTQSSDVS